MGYIVTAEGYIVVAEGCIVVAEGCIVTAEGYIVTAEGYIVTAEGYIVATEGYIVATEGYIVATEGYIVATEGYKKTRGTQSGIECNQCLPVVLVFALYERENQLDENDRVTRASMNYRKLIAPSPAHSTYRSSADPS